ncbi:MAG: DUF134 domain-containing protein, partial [Selenomonas sp.]|uniref:NifB/NifX family molybdenum-iron cluster-binding protein n=1 Tax=Selenomonas sp. TaxID=2053611 RepID=UPI0025EF23F0
MTQEECAQYMGVARTTVQALYVDARKRIAGCLVEARPLLIEGGNFELCSNCIPQPPYHFFIQKGSVTMKLAVTYENGQIFQHFGHTSQFKIYTIEDGAIKESHILESNGAGHGALATLLQEESIDTLICGGIGGGAQNALAEAGITLYGGVNGDADAAVHDFLAGKLAYDPAVHCDHHDHSHGEGHTCGSHGCGGHGHMHGQEEGHGQHGHGCGNGQGQGHGHGFGRGGNH